MGHYSGRGRIPTHHQQQEVCAVNQKIPVLHSEESLQFQLKHKLRHSLGQPHITPNCQLRQTTNSVQPKSSENYLQAWRREKSSDDKELVKHMSSVPKFLQQVEKQKSIKEKALNFGVLDWKHLEKWKYYERMPGKSAKRTPSGNSFRSAGVNFTNQPASQGSIAIPLSGGKWGSVHNTRPSSPQRQLLPPHRVQLSSSKEVRNATFHKEGKDSKKETISLKADLLPAQGQHKLSPSPCNNIHAQGERSDMGFGNEVKTSIESYPAEAQNTLSLVPKLPKNSYTEPMTSLDEQLSEFEGKKLSDFFSTGEFSADCTMDSNNLSTSEACELRVGTNTNPAGKDKCSTVNRETAKSPSSIEGSLKPQTDVSELRRDPSPPRQFSFSLGKMSRSVSSKDASVVQRSSSTYATVKSSQIKPRVSSTTCDTERGKDNPTNKRQSSPLRRLLDPLLKYKGAHSAEIVQPENGNLLPITYRTTSLKEPPHDRNLKASTFQALLHLGLKNGVPFFKLVVDKSEDMMLAAAAKGFWTCEKSDPCMTYTFYSVHEIRKKSLSWMGQGSSYSKSCSVGYNIVGQMKISNFNLPGKCAERECVLYGVDPGQVDKPTFGFVPNKEIAAIIMKNSTREFTDKDQLKTSTKTTLKAEDNKLSNNIVVVLPGGVHGVPIEGMASSLISKWRSGGLCDCGGWDVGCKLRVLADHKNNSSLASTYDIDLISLFERGEEEKGKPVFSLKLLNSGLYSIESNASISLLEAFSICVAYVTCLKFPEIVSMKGLSDAEVVPSKYAACPPLSPTGRI